MTQTAQAFLHIFVFPGPALISESMIVEQGLVFGILQTCFQFAGGSYSTSGPIVGVVCSFLLITRERRRRKIKESIAADTLTFDAAYTLILSAPETNSALEWLAKFCDEMTADACVQQPGHARSQRLHSLDSHSGRIGASGQEEEAEQALEAGRGEGSCMSDSLSFSRYDPFMRVI